MLTAPATAHAAQAFSGSPAMRVATRAAAPAAVAAVAKQAILFFLSIILLKFYLVPEVKVVVDLVDWSPDSPEVGSRSMKKPKVEKVKLATFTKAGRGRNQCKRRRAKQVVHRNRNALGLTEKRKRELGRGRRAGKKERKGEREDEGMQDKMCGWDFKPSGGADTEALVATTTQPLLDPPSLQGGGEGPKIESQTERGVDAPRKTYKEYTVNAPDPDKRYVCVCVRHLTPRPHPRILLRCGLVLSAASMCEI